MLVSLALLSLRKTRELLEFSTDLINNITLMIIYQTIIKLISLSLHKKASLPRVTLS